MRKTPVTPQLLAVFAVSAIIATVTYFTYLHFKPTQSSNSDNLIVYNASYLGFSFFHSKSYSAISITDDPETIVVEPIEARKDTGAIIITARENEPGMTALDWLKSEYSGYNLSYGYTERKIGGVDALLLHWDDPRDIDGALLLTPDGKRLILISILRGDSNVNLFSEFNKILNTFSFEQ